MDYHRLDNFSFGENSQSEHTGYLEFEFLAFIILGGIFLKPQSSKSLKGIIFVKGFKPFQATAFTIR